MTKLILFLILAINASIFTKTSKTQKIFKFNNIEEKNYSTYLPLYKKNKKLLTNVTLLNVFVPFALGNAIYFKHYTYLYALVSTIPIAAVLDYLVIRSFIKEDLIPGNINIGLSVLASIITISIPIFYALSIIWGVKKLKKIDQKSRLQYLINDDKWKWYYKRLLKTNKKNQVYQYSFSMICYRF